MNQRKKAFVGVLVWLMQVLKQIYCVKIFYCNRKRSNLPTKTTTATIIVCDLQYLIGLETWQSNVNKIFALFPNSGFPVFSAAKGV